MNQNEVILGVDTHLDKHVGAVISVAGKLLATQAVETTTAGYLQLLAWARSLGDVRRAGIEGTASRSVLGSMNQLSYLLEGYAKQYAGRTLLEHSLHLSGTPMTALGRDAPFPDIATRAAFSAAGLFDRIAARP